MKKIFFFVISTVLCFYANSESLVVEIPVGEKSACELNRALNVDFIEEIESITLNENNDALFSISKYSLFSLENSNDNMNLNIAHGESLKLEHHNPTGSMIIIYTYCDLEDGKLVIGQQLKIVDEHKKTKKIIKLSKVMINVTSP